MLTLWTYAPGRDGRQALLDRIRSRAERGLRSLLLVPESGSHRWSGRFWPAAATGRENMPR